MPLKETDLTHYLQLRLHPETVAQIDSVIATVPELAEFTRSSFIRAAIRYSLWSTAEHQRQCREATGSDATGSALRDAGE